MAPSSRVEVAFDRDGRALALRADGDVWTDLVRRLFEGAPRWAATARALIEIAETFG